ncbi:MULTISPECIES: HypC/HybG/HupF family hydrogenase formation chaperone [unclassified Frankia]|uniref:HypC/HybG/HupF family hydrogenase formation chaperone n=1 Tax=unclassified Frankia TaxID=2632575 RepID=UPI00202422C2
MSALAVASGDGAVTGCSREARRELAGAPEVTAGAVGGATESAEVGATGGVDSADDGGLTEDLAADLAAASLALARRFAGGATLWCLSPAWGPHAHHIAVEFVHPAVVGKPALPAVAVTGPDPVAMIRLAARPGDVVLAVAAADDPVTRSVLRRAPAWGTGTIWIGSGPRPPAGAADHVLWLDDPDPPLPATGRFVLLYHLLWELAHLCLEHTCLEHTAVLHPSGREQDGREQDGREQDGGTCVTCGDEGRLGEVIAQQGPADGLALVRTATGVELVSILPVDPVTIGDLVLIHAATAITRLDQDGA